MSNTRVLERSFAAGEITPELFARIDVAKAQEGVALCRNFITLPHGPAQNRAGTRMVKAAKSAANNVRVIPFTYNNNVAYAIEIGAGWFRFHASLGTVVYTAPAAYNGATAYAVGDMCSSGGANYYCVKATTGNAPPNATYWYALPADLTYEIPNGYAAADLFSIRFEQNQNVLTLTHPNYPPMELHCGGATLWTLVQPSFNPPAATGLATPTGVATAGTGGPGTVTHTYVVTGVLATTQEETVATSPSAAITNDLTLAGAYNTISCVDSSGGLYVRYNFYKLSQGLYSYIGQAAAVGGTASFVDQNIYPDTTRTPPLADTLFASAGNYPTAVGYHEQRRGFAGSNNDPQTAWFSRTGTDSNMGYNIPVRDDSRIKFKIASREASQVKHIISLQDLIMLTGSVEWRVTTNNQPFTPTTVSVKPQSFIGCNDTRPVVWGNMVLFCSARGGHLREMAYAWQSLSFVTSDASVLAPHLFDGYTITDMTITRGDIPIVWCISSSGKLLGMTYLPDRQIIAWHQHDTGTEAGDVFESVCAINENGSDVLYCVVKRTVNGSVVRYIEAITPRLFTTPSDAFFVDCGSTYSGAPATVITGLSYLEGRTVNILADGCALPTQVVTGGQITLPVAASKVQVGLVITAQLKTAPPYAQVDGAMGAGRVKNINKAVVRVNNTSGLWMGPDFAELTPYAQRTNEPYGTPPALVSDEIELLLNAGWAYSGALCIQQTDPLPVTLVSATLEMTLGGG